MTRKTTKSGYGNKLRAAPRGTLHKRIYQNRAYYRVYTSLLAALCDICLPVCVLLSCHFNEIIKVTVLHVSIASLLRHNLLIKSIAYSAADGASRRPRMILLAFTASERTHVTRPGRRAGKETCAAYRRCMFGHFRAAEYNVNIIRMSRVHYTVTPSVCSGNLCSQRNSSAKMQSIFVSGRQRMGCATATSALCRVRGACSARSRPPGARNASATDIH